MQSGARRRQDRAGQHAWRGVPIRIENYALIGDLHNVAGGLGAGSSRFGETRTGG